MNKRIVCAVISTAFLAGTLSIPASADDTTFRTGDLIETIDYSTLDFYDGENCIHTF